MLHALYKHNFLTIQYILNISMVLDTKCNHMTVCVCNVIARGGVTSLTRGVAWQTMRKAYQKVLGCLTMFDGCLGGPMVLVLTSDEESSPGWCPARTPPFASPFKSHSVSVSVKHNLFAHSGGVLNELWSRLGQAIDHKLVWHLGTKNLWLQQWTQLFTVPTTHSFQVRPDNHKKRSDSSPSHNTMFPWSWALLLQSHGHKDTEPGSQYFLLGAIIIFQIFPKPRFVFQNDFN